MLAAALILGVVILLVVWATVLAGEPIAPATLCWCGHAYGRHYRFGFDVWCGVKGCRCQDFAPARPPAAGGER